MDYEAFVYLWFDSKNRMFYLGFHKGPEDDNYTHSSTIMESFSKQNIPPYMRRKILARGSYDDMTALEVSLLKNRKEKCWDRYYNAIAAFPPPPRFGEDNHSYVHGRSNDPEYKRERKKRYRENNREKARENARKRRENNPEKARESSRKSTRKWRENNPEKVREVKKRYYENNRENEQEKARERYKKNREKILEQKRESYKNKLEKSLQTA